MLFVTDTMQNPTNLILMACICVVVSMAMPCWSDALPASAEIASRPTRPKVFTSPDQLRDYLQELGNYYAIEGRPRCVKRVKCSHKTGHKLPELYYFFNLSARRGGWLTPRRGCFNCAEWMGTPCIGGWFGHRTGLNDSGKLHPHRNSIPRPSNWYQLAILTTPSQPTA